MQRLNLYLTMKILKHRNGFCPYVQKNECNNPQYGKNNMLK